MSLLKLRLSMAGTVAVIISVSTLGFALIISLFGPVDLISLVAVVALFNVGQWLLAPYLVNMLYGVKQVGEKEHPELHGIVERLSRKSGIKTPGRLGRVGLCRYACVILPNTAFHVHRSPEQAARLFLERGTRD